MRTGLLTLLALVACRDTATDTAHLVDADGDGWTVAEDCNDEDASAYPEGIERCDGVDNDCDDEIDEDATDSATFYEDRDGDGYGDAAHSETGCDAPDGYVEDDSDCDDGRDDIHPDAPETDCTDETDYNCDGSTGFTDADGDRYAACEECDDADPAVNPGVIEVEYNGVDDDCDPATFDDDLDEDGFALDEDCDDEDPAVHPDAAEEPYNGVDDDCDEETPDDDLDGDGYTGDVDCDDGDAAINPGAVEEPYNGIDDDCKSATVDDDLDGDGYAAADDCDDADARVSPDATEIPYNGTDDDCDPETSDDDLDGDGYASADDCDDTDAAVSPGAVEEPYNGIDDDCDATTVDDDLDGDGFGTALDCDDADGDVHPLADEVVYDGVDNDCKASTPDDDLDGDGFAKADECDDSDGAIHPDADEIWYDGVDQDCGGDDDFDQDGDGHASFLEGEGADCDDLDADVWQCGTTAETAMPTCLDILDVNPDLPTGEYWVDPDGTGAVQVQCDMETDGGGWTRIDYAADLEFKNWFTAGDAWRFLPEDFETVMTAEQIDALRARSTEGRQQYVGLCEHVIHHYYTDGGTYGYAFGFRLHDGTLTPAGLEAYSPFDITVVKDGCKQNGGEGGDPDLATVFEIRHLQVPVLNVYTRDSGDANEKFGSPLTDNPAWMR